MLARKLVSRLFRPFSVSGTTAADSHLINNQRKLAVIKSGFNKQGLLRKILKVFNDRGIDLYSISGKVIEKDAKGLETCEFELSFNSAKNEIPEVVKEELRNLDLDISFLEPKLIPWFPMQESDLDMIGSCLQSPGDGLNQDHPGFMDKEYKRRRNLIANATLGYKMKDPIPRIEYAPDEQQLWTYIYNKVRPLHEHFGCKEYKIAMNNLEKAGLFNPSTIPQLEDINQFMRNNSNWRIKPVNGILSQREFLNCLALRTFCSTQYIRHPSKPDYTPEPDIMHEFLGHIPNFLDPKVCEISQRLGILSLGASDAQVEMIGAIYWFTIEFGLCMEGKDVKFYGAGPGGSFGEIHHVESMIKNHRDKIYKLDLINNPPPTKFVVQDVQPFYYAAESFDNCLEQLDHYAESFYKPFHLIYDEKSNSYDCDRSIKMKNYVPGV